MSATEECVLLRHPVVRLLGAAAAGAASALALLAILRFANPDAGFARTTAATAFGWLVPVVLGLVSVALVRSLMEGRRPGSGSGGCSVHCTSCGGVVLESWRLCPHCGIPLESQDTEVLCR